MFTQSEIIKTTRILTVSAVVLFCGFSEQGFCHAAGSRKDITPETLLAMLNRKFRDIQSYSCSMKLENHENKLRIEEQMLWYRKPGYIRIEQSGGFYKGVVIDITPEGSIKAYRKGPLSFIKISMDPDDRRLYGITHDHACSADYGAIIRSACRMISDLKNYKITRKVEAGKDVIVFDAFLKGPVEQYRMKIDAERMIISQIERYGKKGLLHRITWKNLRVEMKLYKDLY